MSSNYLRKIGRHIDARPRSRDDWRSLTTANQTAIMQCTQRCVNNINLLLLYLEVPISVAVDADTERPMWRRLQQPAMRRSSARDRPICSQHHAAVRRPYHCVGHFQRLDRPHSFQQPYGFKCHLCVLFTTHNKQIWMYRKYNWHKQTAALLTMVISDAYTFWSLKVNHGHLTFLPTESPCKFTLVIKSNVT